MRRHLGDLRESLLPQVGWEFLRPPEKTGDLIRFRPTSLCLDKYPEALPLKEEPEKRRPMIDPTTHDGDSEQKESAGDVTAKAVLAEYREIENVKLTVLAELDRGTISMRELLRLEVGDVLPFHRPVGENIDLFAADVLIGNAEILAVNDKLAVRIADVNRRLTSSQAKKSSLAESTGGPVPKIRRLASHEL